MLTEFFSSYMISSVNQAYNFKEEGSVTVIQPFQSSINQLFMIRPPGVESVELEAAGTDVRSASR